MDITDTHKETINLDKDSVLNYTLKPNSFARLFFYDRAGVDVKINIDLEENASCEMYGLFHNEGRDPKVTVNLGDALTFNVDAFGHPFYLKTQAGVGTGDLVGGVTNNGTTNGSITFTPDDGVYYYQCSLHGGMFGSIIVTN